MKIRNLGIAAMLLFISGRGQASESQNRNSVGAQISEADTLRAVTALIDAKIIVLDQDPDKMVLRQDVMDKLKATGQYEEAGSEPGTFCY